ncbi:MAG TPA: molybdopterin-dependent oxidoreductase [Acidobacteriaceae bacterium]|nr:molybdopterin-dependent oxidoreductase [Acidobacteriaceae bacterium]
MAALDEVKETRVVHAVCSHDCPDSCGVLVTVESLTGPDGARSERAVKIAGDPAHPVTQGFLCGKVAKYLDRVYSPDRLLYPMRRKKGARKGSVRTHPSGAWMGHPDFERISWDEALDEIAARLKATAAEWGPESILPYSYAGTIGKLGFGSMDRRFFHRLGASQLARTICSEAGGVALKSVYGIKLGTAPEDFERAGLIFAWGANIHGNNIHLWPFIEKARRAGGRLVVIDPYRTRTAAAADEHLAIRPGTDGLLALAMMHVIFAEGLEDRTYMAECTVGGEELRAHALKAEHAPERAAEITGIEAETIRRLAREYALAGREGRRPAAIRLNYGTQRSENGGTAVRAVAMLPLITGAWKYAGGGLQLSTSGAFPWDSDALEMPELMQTSPLGREARTVNMSRLGHALTELGGALHDGEAVVKGEDTNTGVLRSPNALAQDDGVTPDGPPVKAIFVYNSNPAAVAPNQNAVLRGLARTDLFTVVHEQFLTDTAQYADIVLPATTFLETKDVQGAYGHLFVQMSNQAISPLGEARNNTWVFRELARRMGFTEPCFADTDDEMIDQALGGEKADPWFAGTTRERLEREGHIPMAMPRDTDGQLRPFSTAEWFRTRSGRGELTPVPVFVPPAESRGGTAADGHYPLEFLPRKADNYMNSTFANLPGHEEMERKTAGRLEMHPRDAAARGVKDGDAVEIFNGRGSVRLRALVDGTVPEGVVAARLSWNRLEASIPGNQRELCNINALTSERLTDIGGGATFYSTLVEVRRVANPS